MSNGTTTWGPREYLAVLVSLIVGGVTVLGILKGLSQSTKAAPGDEPPITVKHGSIKLDLAASKGSQKWNQNADKWEIGDNSGNGQEFNHNSNKYDVVVGTTSATACPTGTFAQAASVTFNYSDGNWVTVALDGSKKTSVTASKFNKNWKDKELEFDSGTGNFIKSVVINGDTAHPFCSFGKKDDLGEIALLDSY